LSDFYRQALLSTNDLNLWSLFGSDCARRADYHICQSADRVATEKHLEGVLCTNSDLKIVTIFWDTQSLFRETMIQPPLGDNESPSGDNEPPSGDNEPPSGDNEPPSGDNDNNT